MVVHLLKITQNLNPEIFENSHSKVEFQGLQDTNLQILFLNRVSTSISTLNNVHFSSKNFMELVCSSFHHLDPNFFLPNLKCISNAFQNFHFSRMTKRKTLLILLQSVQKRSFQS